MGKTLHTDNGKDLLITGIMKDFPTTSHFSCEFLESMVSYPESQNQQWLMGEYTTYIVLRKDCNPVEFDKKLTTIMRDYVWASSVNSSWRSHFKFFGAWE